MSNFGATISIQSHSKQVKLLNDYIASLEKKVNDERETSTNKMVKLSEEANRLHDDNIRVKNQLAQTKFAFSKQEELIRRLPQLQKELEGTKRILQKEVNDKNALIHQHGKLIQQLRKCEIHLEAAEKEVNQRTGIFNKDSAYLTDMIEKAKNACSDKDKKISELENTLAAQTKRLTLQLQQRQRFSNDIVKSKNETIGKLAKELQEMKKKLADSFSLCESLKSSHGAQAQQLLKQIGDYRVEIASWTNENAKLQKTIQQKDEEISGYAFKLNMKSLQHDSSVKSNNEEKSNLIRIVRRLEEEKKTLQEINAAAKEENLKQAKQSKDLTSFNSNLQQNLNELSQQLSELKVEYAELMKVKEYHVQQLQLTQGNLSETSAGKAEAFKIIQQKQKAFESLSQQYQETKIELLGSIKTKEEENLNLNKKIEQLLGNIDTLNKQKMTANAEIARVWEGQNNSEKFYDQKIKQMEKQFQVTIEELRNTRQNLRNVTREYEAYQKKKENQIEVLTKKLESFISDQAILKNQSDSTVKDYLAYKKAKQNEVDGLNGKIKELTKQNTGLKQSLDKLKEEYSLFQKRKEAQIDDLSLRLRDLQKEHATLKDNFDNLTREYYTFQKKKETDIDSLNERIKEAGKKIEKKDLKIKQLEEDIKNTQKLSEAAIKSMDSTQKEELDHLKDLYITQNTSIKKQLSQTNLKAQQLTTEKQELIQKVQKMEIQVKSLKDELRSKQISNTEQQKKMQLERDKLLNQIKDLNLSTVMVSQSKNSKEMEAQSLRKTISNLQTFIAEQKKSMENVSKLLSDKEKEIQSLESSNTMLRKQLINSINNEEISRKQVTDLKKGGSMIMNGPPMLPRSTQRISKIKHKQSVNVGLHSIQGRYAESMVGSGEIIIQGDKKSMTSIRHLNGSIIDDISKLSTKSPPERESTTKEEQLEDGPL